MSPLSPLHVSGRSFVDAEGRRVILRGVNLSGSTKVPFVPNGATQNKDNWPPTDLKNVSWIGRPFPREEAEEHFTRMKAWGFNCLRFLTTWEAIEHAGPYQYDEAYLDYYADMVKMAGDYGFYVFVDPHQDVWSRVTGGDGAPLWLFDKIGLDYTKFDAAGMVLNMQYLWDPDKKKNKYPSMCWGENYKYLTNGMMWALFYAGRDFAPKLMLQDEKSGQNVNVQDYFQTHFIQCMVQVAKRVKDFPHVFGFDSLNEPNHGIIGHKAITRNLRLKDINDPPYPGLAWTPVDGMYAAAGHSFPLEKIGINILKLTLAPVGKVVVNPNHVSIWKEGAEDFWKTHGVWAEGPTGPLCPNDDYFRVVNGRQVQFFGDYLLPFAGRYAEAIRALNPNWIMLIEDEPPKSFLDPDIPWPSNTPANVANCYHWYDPVISQMKRFFWPITLEPDRIRPVFGLRGVQKMYLRQLAIQPRKSANVNGGNCPCLVGEFGCHMDLNKGRAYKQFPKKGQKAFKWTSIALDLMYNALDTLQLSGTVWAYTPDNTNAFGENWNQEDLSFFSRDQQGGKDWRLNINAGGRAINGFCRPFARKIAGTLLKMEFHRKRGSFYLEYQPDPKISAPSEIYVPTVQFPNGFEVACTGAEWHHDEPNHLLWITNPKQDRVTIQITRKYLR